MNAKMHGVCPTGEPLASPSPQFQEPLLATVDEASFLLGIGKTKIFAMLHDEWAEDTNEQRLERRKIGSATRVTMRSIRKLAGVSSGQILIVPDSDRC